MAIELEEHNSFLSVEDYRGFNRFVNEDEGSPQDLNLPVRIYSRKVPKRLEKFASIKQIVHEQSGRRNSESKKNQNLIFSTRQLNATEVQILLHELFIASNSLGKDDLLLNCWLYISLMLSSGREDTALLQFERVSEKSKKEGLVAKISDGKPEIFLSFLPNRHILKSRKNEKINDFCQQISTKNVELEFVEPMSIILKNFLSIKKKNGFELYQPVISYSKEKIKKKASKIIKKINRKHNTELSLTKIRRFMRQSIEQYTGDTALTFFMRNLPNSEKPPEAFYAAFDVERFQEVFKYYLSSTHINQAGRNSEIGEN